MQRTYEQDTKIYAKKKSEWFCSVERLKKEIELKDDEINRLQMRVIQMKDDLDSNRIDVNNYCLNSNNFFRKIY